MQSYHLAVVVKTKIKTVLNAKQNIYSPNRFHLTFPHDESGNFDKFLNVMKK